MDLALKKTIVVIKLHNVDERVEVPAAILRLEITSHRTTLFRSKVAWLAAPPSR